MQWHKPACCLRRDGEFTSPTLPAGSSDRRNSTSFFHLIASHSKCEDHLNPPPSTLYPAELRVRRGSFSRLARGGQCPAGGWLGEEQGPKGNGHTFESCRVRQGKEGAERAGIVAGKIFEPRQFRHLCVNSTAGRPDVRIELACDGYCFYFRFRGRADMLADIGPQCNPHSPRIGVVLDFRSVYIARWVLACSPPYPTAETKGLRCVEALLIL